MPDEPLDLGQAGSPQGPLTDVADGEPSPEAGEGGPYLHTWKTKQDAEQGIKDLTEQLNESRSKGDKALSEIERLKDDVLSKLVDASTKSGPAEKSPEQVEAELAKLAETIDNAPDSKVLVGVLQAAMQDAEEGGYRRAAKEIEPLKETIALIQQTQVERDPQVLAQEKKIQELGLGEKFPDLDKRMLATIAALVPDKTQQPPRADIPGAIGGGPAVVAEEGKVSVEDISMLEQIPGIGKITEADKKNLATRGSK